MATANQIADEPTPSERPDASLLVRLAAMPPEQLASVLANLTASFPADGLTIATPNTLAADSWPHLRIISISATGSSWTLSAADFVNAYQLAEENSAQAILMLGPGAESLRASALRDLANGVLHESADLAVPCYDLSPHAGLINSAILYPLTRALFSSRARFPLAIDLGLSRRMAERMAATAQRFTKSNPSDAILWPINEAAVAGLSSGEVDVGPRATPQPAEPDINAILASVTGSLFADIDAKAAFWQRVRYLPPPRTPSPPAPSADASADIAPMLDAFQLAYTNLQEIWSLV